MRHAVRLSLTTLCFLGVLMFSACSGVGGGNHGSPGPSADVPGILVQGAPQASAIDQLEGFFAELQPEDLRTAVDPASNKTYYDRQLHASVIKTASVAHVNDALNASGARIIASGR